MGERAGGVDRRSMAVLSVGHMFTDVSQGAVPALLPFLITRHHLSYASASALVLAATLASSIVQPLFGHLSDRRSLPWLMPLGPLVGTLGIGLAGLAPNYGLLFAAIVLSGFGVAAFHPEGSRFANYVSGAKRASGMSLFSVGGNAGFALGPALVTPLVLAFGLSGAFLLVIPGALMAAVMVFEMPRLRCFRVDLAAEPAGEEGPRPQWRPFARLSGVIVVRSFVYFGLVTFIPLYFLHDLHSSKATASAALAVMLLGGAAGTLVGGPLADRIGRRAVLIGSLALLPLLVVAVLLVGTVPAIVILAFTGAATIATFAVTIVMGQEFLPGRIGMASGFTIGLSIGLGGVGAPLLGLVADAHGLRAAFEVMAVLPLLGIALAVGLPRGAEAAQGARASAQTA